MEVFVAAIVSWGVTIISLIVNLPKKPEQSWGDFFICLLNPVLVFFYICAFVLLFVEPVISIKVCQGLHL